MTDQENINHAVQVQIAAQNARIELQNAKIAEQGRRIDATLEELKQQRQDIRELNKTINDNQKEFMQQLHNNFVQTLIGVGGMMVALGAFLVAVLKWGVKNDWPRKIQRRIADEN